MDDDSKYHILPQDRCTYQYRTGQQCAAKSFFNERCRKHGGLKAFDEMEKRIYSLANAETQRMIGEQIDHEKFYSLREEIALIRINLAELANTTCNSPAERRMLLPAVQSLGDLIRRLLADSLKMEKETGNLQTLSWTITTIDKYREFIANAAIEQGISIDFIVKADAEAQEYLRKNITPPEQQ